MEYKCFIRIVNERLFFTNRRTKDCQSNDCRTGDCRANDRWTNHCRSDDYRVNDCRASETTLKKLNSW
jgi:hypothetical protein